MSKISNMSATFNDATIASPANGLICEAAYYNAALTDEEIFILSLGISPGLVRPNNLVSYLPLIGTNIDPFGNTFSVVGNLTGADHPRMFY